MRQSSENARAAFRQTVQAAREKLIHDITNEATLRYTLQARDRSKIRLRHSEAADWAVFEPHAADLARLAREKAYTTANRLAFLFMMEARGVRNVPLVSRGTTLSPLRDNAEFFSGITGTADQGWTYLLDEVWDSLASDLPALFARSALMDALPVPGPTLVWLINEFAKSELAEVWLDDTTPGWLYQYWNDPDRKAVDEKLKNTTGKVEAGELAHKTQLFTERYMVEWLVQNSLGSQWLALCNKNGYTFTVDPTNEFWKFYIDADVSADSIAHVPSTLSQFKVLDPAMGSGHFLVYVFDFLFELYRAESAFRNMEFNPSEAVDSILCNNLHGIDIDNRAVQIAAASLLVKAREKAPGYTIRKLNLVATDLGLASLAADDPALAEFTETLSKRTGLPKAEGLRLVEMLKSADYMGSLLQVNEEIKKLATFFDSDEVLEEKIHGVLAKFIKNKDSGNDLGVHTLAEQLEKGLRLITLLGQQYDVIVANPPYLGLGKVAEKIAENYEAISAMAKGDLYTLFMITAERLTKPHGNWCMVAQHNWMFLGSFQDFRVHTLKENHITALAQLGSGAFEAISGEVVGAAMFVASRCKSTIPGAYQRVVHPVTPKDKTAMLISRERTYRFPQERFADIPGSPMIYWWPEEFRQAYLKAKKLGEVGEVKQGLATANNDRYVRNAWEVLRNSISTDGYSQGNDWYPYVKGAAGKRWFEPINEVVNWNNDGIEIKNYLPEGAKKIASRPQATQYYFRQGLAFSYIGTNGFLCRLRKYKSIFDVSGSSIFCDNPEKMQVLLSSNLSGYVSQSINPTINNQVGDIENLPVFDYLSDWKQYLDRARALYDELFASTETNIEYRYRTMDSEFFEVEEARIRDEIDKEILARFSADTQRAIYEEIGESPFDYPATETIPADFNDAYLASDSVIDLAHKLRMHPDRILAIKNERGLVHPAQREARAFQHLSWAVGVLLGRFDQTTGGLLGTEGADGPGIEAERPEGRVRDSELGTRTWSGKPDDEKSANADFSAGPQGLIYLSALDDIDGLPRTHKETAAGEVEKSVRRILREKHGAGAEGILAEIDEALVRTGKRQTLGEWIRLDAFARHKELYENRPIYFPLASEKKNFFVWVNIHRWNEGTLNAILANYLYPDRDMLDARVRRLREDIVHASGDKRIKNELEDTVYDLDRLKDELASFVALVQKLATVGPAPDLQEAQAPFTMDLDDGVMVNSAALWELVLPLWKDPKKWWEILSKPAGKKDYDWSHLAMRYWPTRVFEKVKKDPSLAVAHSDYGVYAGRDLFRELHPEAAKKWDEQQGKKDGGRVGADGGTGGGTFVRRDDGELEF